MQGALAAAIEAFCGERVDVHGAGRTDAGVHALGQVAHVDLAKDWDADTVRDAINAHLRPHPVAVLAAEKVPDTFDARFSATKRHYRYRIVNRRADLALERGRAWRMRARSTPAAMHRPPSAWSASTTSPPSATSTARRNRRSRRSTSSMSARDGEEVRVTASARSFLHTQVRSMVGALVAVGEGRWTADDLAAALDRARPRGLRHGGAAGRALSGAGGL